VWSRKEKTVHGGKASLATTLSSIDTLQRGFTWQLAEALRAHKVPVGNVTLAHDYRTCDRYICVEWYHPKNGPQKTNIRFSAEEPIENILKTLMVSIRMESA
jgi:hypothetical protein